MDPILRDPGAPPADRLEENIRWVIEAAVWAPSVHNTQPWWFGRRGARISLHADAERRLEVSDPAGRDMLISCGAALYTLRVAILRLGYAPQVHLLPGPPLATIWNR